MARFLQLGFGETWTNPDHVIQLVPQGIGSTQVILSTGAAPLLAKPIDEVLAMLTEQAGQTSSEPSPDEIRIPIGSKIMVVRFEDAPLQAQKS